MLDFFLFYPFNHIVTPQVYSGSHYRGPVALQMHVIFRKKTHSYPKQVRK